MRRLSILLFLIALPFAVFSQPYQGNLTPTGNIPTEGGGIPCDSPENAILNCSFETGDFTDWIVTDLGMPFIDAQVVVGGLDPGFGFFLTAPTDGTFAGFNGFDGDGATSGFPIEFAQDVNMPEGIVTLTFDYRGAWDTTFGATLDRTFEVQVQPAGGGAALQTDLILTAPPNDTTTDTGPQTANVDLSAFAGSNVRVALVWNIPEDFTGPGAFQIDNVSLTGTGEVLEVPTLSQWGMIIAMLLLAGVGVYTLRRRPTS